MSCARRLFDVVLQSSKRPLKVPTGTTHLQQLKIHQSTRAKHGDDDFDRVRRADPSEPQQRRPERRKRRGRGRKHHGASASTWQTEKKTRLQAESGWRDAGGQAQKKVRQSGENGRWPFQAVRSTLGGSRAFVWSTSRGRSMQGLPKLRQLLSQFQSSAPPPGGATPCPELTRRRLRAGPAPSPVTVSVWYKTGAFRDQNSHYISCSRLDCMLSYDPP